MPAAQPDRSSDQDNKQIECCPDRSTCSRGKGDNVNQGQCAFQDTYSGEAADVVSRSNPVHSGFIVASKLSCCRGSASNIPPSDEPTWHGVAIRRISICHGHAPSPIARQRHHCLLYNSNSSSQSRSSATLQSSAFTMPLTPALPTESCHLNTCLG